MRTIFTLCLLLAFNVFAGGAGTGATDFFAVCQNHSGDKISINFQDSIGYILQSSKTVDGNRFYLTAKTWSYKAPVFAISFLGSELQATFLSQGLPMKSSVFDRPSQLKMTSKHFVDGQFSCLNW